MANAGFGIKDSSTGDFVTKLEGDGDAKIGDSSGDLIQITGSLSVKGDAVFNEGSEDKDFRVESNHNTHMFYIDGGNNRIGIGNNSPQHVIDIRDPFDAISGHTKDAIIRIQSKENTGIKLIADTDGDASELDNPFIDWYQDGHSDASGRSDRLASIAMEGPAGTTFTGSLANSFFLDAYHPNIGHSSRPLQIVNSSTNGGHKARITLEGTNGYVGIHTTTPTTPLEILGTTMSTTYATTPTTQDLGTGATSTLSTDSGLIFLDADQITSADVGGGFQAHTLTINNGSTSGQKLTIVVESTFGAGNNIPILLAGNFNGVTTGALTAGSVTSLSFVYYSTASISAWYQVAH